MSEAWSVLSDEKRRKKYDQARLYVPRRLPGPDGNRTGTGGFGFDLNDIFSGAGDAGGRLGDLFGGVFGGGGRTTAQNRPRRGPDVETDTTLSFADSIDGTTVALRLVGEGACPTCRGTGAKAGTVPKVCPTCNGTGQSSQESRLVRDYRAVQGVPRPRPGGGRPLPGLLGQRPGDRARAPSRRGSRRASPTASGSRSPARARPASAAARPATCTSACT